VYPSVLPDQLAAYLQHKMPDAREIEVSQLWRIPGGASRETWSFEAAWSEDGAADQPRSAGIVHVKKAAAGFEVWFGLLTPKNTPAPVVGVLAKEIRRILSEPGIPERFEVLGFTVVGSTPAEFDALIKKEVQRWPKLIRELGIQSGN